MTFEAILDRLQNVKGTGESRVARCPAHEDNRQSLSVSEGEDGRILLKCHAGCPTADIVGALGIKMRDLYPDCQNGSGAKKPLPTIAATYDYPDERGGLRFQSVRYDPKDFKQRRPDGRGGWIWNLQGVERVPFRLPELIQAVERGDLIFIVEGEKDCNHLHALGLTATTNPGGAGKWRGHGYERFLAGARVCILPDNDPPGRKHGEEVAQSLNGIAAEVRVLELPNLPAKGDVSNWLDAGGTPGELIRLIEAAPVWTPSTSTNSADTPLEILDENGRIIPLRVAEEITRKRRLICVGGQLYQYEGGVYKRRENWVIERDATELIGVKSRRGILGDILKLVEVKTAIDPDALHRAGRVINLANGLLDLDAGLKPHSPEFLSVTQIPINFDSAAECPTWGRCLAEWFPHEPDVIALLQEWFGLCLVPDPTQHKAMLLLGEGANGKSVLCNVLKSLVGHENVSAVSLNALSKSFAVAELFGKLVNLTVEVEVREGIEEGIFKQVVAGDPIQAERKYGHPFLFRPYARFTIATNNLFHVDDRSDGFYRRLLIVRFNQTFAEEKQDKRLHEKLEMELSGILNWALIGLARLEGRGQFLVPRRVQDEVAEFRRQNNPVASWAEERAQISPSAWTSSADLYASYREWAGASGHRPLAKNKFGIDLKRIKGVSPRPHHETRNAGYDGIELKDAPTEGLPE